MIERLVITLRQLARLDDATLRAGEHARLRGDCADALRLELDCMQQSLTARQRQALARLGDLLESNVHREGELPAAVRDACASLDLPFPDRDHQ